MHFPYDELALEKRLDRLQIALLRSGGKRRQVLSPEEQAVQSFGRDLFDALLTGEARSCYDVSCREARQRGQGLRFKLRIQSPEMACLPWEFLYDQRKAEYICLSRDTPIVRYLELPQPVEPLTVTPPLRILGMIASPDDLPPLDLDREKQRVELALQSLQASRLVELSWLEDQTWRELQRAMRGGPWHIFHFIGHGSFDNNADEGLVALSDENGLTHRLFATELGRLLSDHHSLRLALLNSCEGGRGSERDIFSSTASILVRRGLPAVLAMQNEITDRAAIEFARSFYEALTDGLPVDAAVSEARKAISLAVPNSVEWGTPVLYMRAPQGIIFQVPESRVKQRTAKGSLTGIVKELQQQLDQFYTDGLSAFWVEEWDKACRSFQAILDVYPQYPGAAAKLKEAERHRKLSELYTTARAAQDAGDWPGAQTVLEALVSEAADYKDSAEQLRFVKKQRQLADLYAEAHRLHQANQWQAVVNVFTQIKSLDPQFVDADGLLSTAEHEVAAQKRQGELQQRYGEAVRALDAGNWQAARQLLEQLQATEPGFRETGRLLKKAQAEIEHQEKEQQRKEQIAILYEQALGLARARQWRQALDKMQAIYGLDAQFPDPEGIVTKAQAEVEKEEEDARRRNEAAALYAEAVRLLKMDKYQEALEKWTEVQALDPSYPDRQRVLVIAKLNLETLTKPESRKRQISKQNLALGGGLGLIILFAVLVAVFNSSTPNDDERILWSNSMACKTILDGQNESPWIKNAVTLDGRMSRKSEWSDALCIDLALKEKREGPKTISSRWWFKNDGQWLYVLARLPVSEINAKGVFTDYFWPKYIGHWDHSDGAYITQKSETSDVYGWDEENWYEDTLASPPGQNNVEGAASQDTSYYWFEFRKAFTSNDGKDWTLKPGDQLGFSTDSFLVGSTSGESNFFAGNIALYLGSP
jgi:outer membrane protein assembly factor BamD (BamD/ComL family)